MDMKLDRLLAIVIMLVNRRMVQAKELADTFEVSVRTIYRDIDVINQAGIPVISYQGAGGGISLSEGYRLDRNVFTNNELVAIVSALQSVSTTHFHTSNKHLLEKMNSIVPATESEQFKFQTQQFIVDLSPWGKQSMLEEKLAKVKAAIEGLYQLAFTYCSAEGELSQRIVEPYTLVLKKHTWYLYAYCLKRQQFRLFKLIRMNDVAILEHSFVRINISIEQIPWNQEWTTPEKTTRLVLRFHKSAKHLAEEWFGVESLVAEAGDGTGDGEKAGYIVETDFPENRWLYGFILSFGPDVEVIEPAHIRRIILDMAMNISNIYKPTS
jgi:predicted DNA-binding transcriptional regulator YafY